jgi:hypothetical protein
MAGSKRPSFLKRQKEQQRIARANEKREVRRARKHAKSLGLTEPGEGDGTDALLEPTEMGDDAAGAGEGTDDTDDGGATR